MERMILLASSLASTAIIAGCAANSGVVQAGNGTYLVSRQAATGFSGSGTLKADALREADKFCTGLHKSLEILQATEAQPPYLLGNFPKAEIQFRCIDSVNN